MEKSTEEAFKGTPVPSWKEQITMRAMVTSLVLSVIFNFIVTKLALTTGVIPSLNVAAGLLGFAAVKVYVSTFQKIFNIKQPFTRQENTVIQTCIVASSGLAFSSGAASNLLGMSPRVAAQTEEANTAINIKQLSLGWMFGFLFAVSFVGLFSIVALRKTMILKLKLTYPSGTATAHLINSFHTPKGAKLAKKQVAVLFKTGCLSFAFALFQWFFATADGCGFSSFPTFGLTAYKSKFYFDFSSTYVGVGMICPYIINVSLLLGAIISWGIMWPLIETKKGIWYPSDISPSSLHGIQGYRVFIAISTMLGDGFFHIVYMMGVTIHHAFFKSKKVELSNSKDEVDEYNEAKRKEYFTKDEIPTTFAVAGYIILCVISIISVPAIFPQLKWYQIMVAYILAPLLAFCNAYGCGLTDWSLASNYGKVAIFAFSSWVGIDHGGIVAGLAACGVMMNIVSTASDLMQDFKTGYLTLSSPRSMFVSQVIGTAMGCVLTPLVFWFFNKTYAIGDPDGSYPAPYGLMYRGIAILGSDGFSSLPKHCMTICIVVFFLAIAVNVLREVLKKWETKYGLYQFVPSPMSMAIPFYLGGYFAVDMCVGSLILFVWRRSNKLKADQFVPAVASGLICGDSLWGIPAALMSLAGISAPICMKFLSASVNSKVDAFLGR
ncbi:probable metal-nicotianamine transporter YSL7 [Impatiens glandulifera]|uniref:probable metal-nicotianamine transporter YSL7 n=1 Tax=Impatiens glandulifera TaxID=253017 RepID=UPI001FB0AEC6|nr:probable metal-nicotianamine transporter YSL7 [Impatiens glandulifera]